MPSWTRVQTDLDWSLVEDNIQKSSPERHLFERDHRCRGHHRGRLMRNRTRPRRSLRVSLVTVGIMPALVLLCSRQTRMERSQRPLPGESGGEECTACMKVRWMGKRKNLPGSLEPGHKDWGVVERYSRWRIAATNTSGSCIGRLLAVGDPSRRGLVVVLG